jgi:hypothetical protein
MACGTAVVSILTRDQREWARDQNFAFIACCRREYVNVALVGIARLKYRQKTAMTAAWWADQKTKAER